MSAMQRCAPSAIWGAHEKQALLAKALKREAQVIRDGFCVSYAPINPAMVAWPYRRLK